MLPISEPVMESRTQASRPRTTLKANAEAKDSTLKAKAESKDSTLKAKTMDVKIVLEDPRGRGLVSRTPTLLRTKV